MIERRSIRCISVPKNKKGEEDCDYGYFDSEDIIDFDVSDEEFWALKMNGSIDEINIDCDLLIQDYETETIPVEKIARCMAIIREHGEFVNGAFMSAFKHALNYGTFAQLEF